MGGRWGDRRCSLDCGGHWGCARRERAEKSDVWLNGTTSTRRNRPYQICNPLYFCRSPLPTPRADLPSSPYGAIPPRCLYYIQHHRNGSLLDIVHAPPVPFIGTASLRYPFFFFVTPFSPTLYRVIRTTDCIDKTSIACTDHPRF